MIVKLFFCNLILYFFLKETDQCRQRPLFRNFIKSLKNIRFVKFQIFVKKFYKTETKIYELI